MAKPPYVEALEHFKQSTDDPLIAYVAFALYVESEYTWAAKQTAWPTPAVCRGFYNVMLPDNGRNYTDNADTVLVEFANNIVDQQRDEFSKEVLAAVKPKWSDFWWGIGGNLIAALIYSIFLIVGSYIAVQQGIDLIESYHRAVDKIQAERKEREEQQQLRQQFLQPPK